jgi:multimeric flavodoxin WrbA
MKLDLKIINEQALIRLREAEVAFPCDGCDECDEEYHVPCSFDDSDCDVIIV